MQCGIELDSGSIFFGVSYINLYSSKRISTLWRIGNCFFSVSDI